MRPQLALLARCLIIWVCCASGCHGNWWNLGFLSWKPNHRLDQTLILSAQPTCSSIAGLSPKQTLFCQRHFALMPAVTHGARLGMQECATQFKLRRWNCGATLSSGVAFGPVADDSTRESSFAHAISAAGVVHAISRACKRAVQDGEIQSANAGGADGDTAGGSGGGGASGGPSGGPNGAASGTGLAPFLSQCGCSKALRPRGLNRDWIWGGCGDDIMFGYEFAKNFIDARESEQNHPRYSPELARTMVNLHNNEVGRQIVFKNAEIGCKCHGVSGSCSLRTCWQQLPAFGQIGDRLLAMYDSAARVKISKKGTEIRRVEKRKPRKPRQAELVYLTESPDYCKPNSALGILGTKGRECLPNPEGGPTSCKELCCGRGHVARLVRESRSCQCKFEWCCHVKCRPCEEEKVVHVCN